MKSHPSFRLQTAFVIASIVTPAAVSANPIVDLPSGGARFDSYVSPAGKAYFAASFRLPDVAVPDRGRDVVVLVDTSASQTGIYRRMTLAAFDEITAGLAPSDRVQLMAVDLQWTVTPTAANPDNTYLAQLVDMARRDAGLSLPTVGTAGLEETRRLIGLRVRNLDRLARQAVATGNYQGAHLLASAAIERDPLDLDAQVIRASAQRLQAAGDVTTASSDLLLVGPEGAAADVAVGDSLMDEDGQFVDQVEAHAEVVTEAVQTEVAATLEMSRRLMATDPSRAKQDLKLLLEMVRKVPEVAPAVEAQLVDQITAALKEVDRREIEKDALDQQAEELAAAAREQQQLNDRLLRRIDKEKQLVERLRSLVLEGRYEDATYIVAPEIQALDPDAPIARSATLWARISGDEANAQAVRIARWRGVVDAMYQVELSSVPFPDDPPIVYPDASEWEALTQRRKKWSQVDLSQSGPAEEKIRRALEETTRVDFTDTPLNDALGELQDQHGINIHIAKTALEDEGIGTDSPVNLKLDGVTLKSALKLMLKDLGLTYVVENEVMMITTQLEAQDAMSTKVYPVADLVIPISSGLGGGGFGGGGGGLGGGGLGGGGFGGGGLGGGGLGGGGGGFGGGFFSVPDEIDTQSHPPAQAAAIVPDPSRLAANSSTVAHRGGPAQSESKKAEPTAVDDSLAPDVFWPRRGRDGPFGPPPAQIPASQTTALSWGSDLVSCLYGQLKTNNKV